MALPDSTLTEDIPPTTVLSRSSRRRNRKKMLSSVSNTPQKKTEPAHTRWKTEAQQQIYSSKLIEALSKVDLHPVSPSAPRRGRVVREAADRALALTARGRTLWSRAILINRVKLKFRKNQNKLRAHRLSHSSLRAPATAEFRASRKQRFSVTSLSGKKNIPAVQRKARVLGRLVPGCRKESLPVILEETSDYIAALEMQIRTMSALAELLSGGSSSSITSGASSSSTSS